MFTTSSISSCQDCLVSLLSVPHPPHLSARENRFALEIHIGTYGPYSACAQVEDNSMSQGDPAQTALLQSTPEPKIHVAVPLVQCGLKFATRCSSLKANWLNPHPGPAGESGRDFNLDRCKVQEGSAAARVR